MAEGFELPEGPHEHEDNPFLVPVSVTISILAVLVAGVTLLGHRAHTEELLLQAQATDQWAYYQAKNIRLHEMQFVADIFSTLAPADKEKAAAMYEKYAKEAERYASDKDDISEKAKDLEKERDFVSRRADHFDGGEGLLEVGLVICSMTLLTKRRGYWIAGMLIGAGGVLFALTAYLVR
jgi:ABC-type Zn uptake system ZnuABC Zn-binding protein ZnuA